MRTISCLLALSLCAIGTLLAEPVSLLSGSRMLAESDLIVAVRASSFKSRAWNHGNYITIRPDAFRVFKGKMPAESLTILTSQAILPERPHPPSNDSPWLLLYLKKAYLAAWQYTSRHPLQQDITLPPDLDAEKCADLAELLALSAEKSALAQKSPFIWLLGGLPSTTATECLQKLSASSDPALATLALRSRLLTHDSTAIPAARELLASEKLSPSDRALLAIAVSSAE